MTLDELHSRWLIGPCQVDCVVVNVAGHPRFKRDGLAHSAMLGDFIQAYIEHTAIPWYRKKWDWKIVRNEMIRYLNVIEIRFSTLK